MDLPNTSPLHCLPQKSWQVFKKYELSVIILKAEPAEFSVLNLNGTEP